MYCNNNVNGGDILYIGVRVGEYNHIYTNISIRCILRRVLSGNPHKQRSFRIETRGETK